MPIERRKCEKVAAIGQPAAADVFLLTAVLGSWEIEIVSATRLARF